MGEIFMFIIAGKDKKEPPPATAFSKPARKEATVSQSQRQFKSGRRLERCIDFILNGEVGVEAAKRLGVGGWSGHWGDFEGEGCDFRRGAAGNGSGFIRK
jgi:hypothetical protein